MEMCSKCGKNPRADADSTNPWCKQCKAEKQKEYQAGRKEMFKSRGFVEGVKETKDVLAAEFERLGCGSFSGYECADLIRRAPGPLPD